MVEKRIRIGVLASGSGTNLEAIANAIERGEVPAEIAIVLSDNPKAFALQRAKKHGIPAKVILPSEFSDRREYETALISELKRAEVELVALAGYMRLVGQEFLVEFKGRIMNIHPALLPSYPGTHAVRGALQYGAKVSGVTVHFVDDGIDTGPIIIQRAVPVLENDDEESLHQRIHEQEYKAYPEAIRLFAEGRLKIEGRRVRVLGETSS
ncbi:MAG: phosphoribosylglycinamide formyltransferase [Actinomycetota bacterium]|nr:phosphoribosylglycinamide formyltransferase [Actinomycetota bacterium]